MVVTRVKKYEDLRNSKNLIINDAKQDLLNLNIISSEALRVAEVASNSKQIFEDLDAEFARQTGLDTTDMKFLFFATALQICRWILISKLNETVSDKMKDSRVKDNDSDIKKMERKERDSYKKKHEDKWEHNKSEKYPSWLEIVYSGAPYDVSVGSQRFGVNMEGMYHRIHTLGHDPIAGWLFGPMNFISGTITLEDFRTYTIAGKPKSWEKKITLCEGFVMAFKSIKEDEKRLPAAIFAQALHLKSDVFTKLGLPIPLLQIFNPDLAGELYKNKYDSLCAIKDIAVVGDQVVVGNIINMLITLIHGLYFDPQKYKNRDIYEVKTRKILSYSNTMSSASNIIYVAFSKDIKKLDIGGFLVTLYRLVNDSKFKRDIQREFLEKEFYNIVIGEEYDF